MPEGAFEKDFSYLMPFLDKIASASGAVSDPALREELAQLVSGQKERWTRIREILSGAAIPASEPGKKLNDSNSNSDNDSSSAAPDKPVREQFQFTVGSLRRGNR